MLIFDASPVIAILEQSGYIEFFEKLSKVDSDLVVPDCVMPELYEADQDVIRYARSGILRVENISQSDKNYFGNVHPDYSKTGLRNHEGEYCAMVAYNKHCNSDNVRCVIDDYDASIRAVELGIRHVTLVDLVRNMEKDRVIRPDTTKFIIETLRFNGYRVPVTGSTQKVYCVINMNDIKSRLDMMWHKISNLDADTDKMEIEHLYVQCIRRISTRLKNTHVRDIPKTFPVKEIKNDDFVPNIGEFKIWRDNQLDIITRDYGPLWRGRIKNDLVKSMAKMTDEMLRASHGLLTRDIAP